MPKTIEIKMTLSGFDVTAGGRTATFKRLDEAVGFAKSHLERVQEIRDLSARIG